MTKDTSEVVARLTKDAEAFEQATFYGDAETIESDAGTAAFLRECAALISSLVAERDDWADPVFQQWAAENRVVTEVWEILGGQDSTREGGQSLVRRVTELRDRALTAERLLAEARAALKPFAEKSKAFDEAAQQMGFAPSYDEYKPRTEFTHGDLRKARAALSEGEP